MRHVRKLLLAAMTALALCGAMASGASAAVEVSNGGPFEIQGTLGVDGPGPGLAWGTCNVAMTAESSPEGAVTLSEVWFSQIYLNATYCEQQDACGGEAWEAQILGPGDEGYLGVADFELLVPSMCISGLGAKPLRISLKVVPGGESWSVPRQPVEGTPYEWIAEGYGGQWAGYSEFGIESVEE